MTNIVGHFYKPAWIFPQSGRPRLNFETTVASFEVFEAHYKLTWKSRL